MRVVDQCRLYPGRCSVLPHLGGSHPLGYVDTFQDNASGERVYVSVYAVGLIAEGLGFRRAGDESMVVARNRVLEARVAELEGELVEARGQVDAVRVLKASGFTQANPPGRPRKVAA